jgi:hypothetical protein
MPSQGNGRSLFPASLLLPHLAPAGVLLARMAGDWLTGMPD